MVRNAIAVGLLVALFSMMALAQDTPPDKPDFSIVERFVMTPVTVTDHSGNIINGLTPEDFAWPTTGSRR